MKRGPRVRLVLLKGGRSDDDGESPPSRVPLRLVRSQAARAENTQAALETKVAAAREVRRGIEERIARALEDLARERAPDAEPR